MDKGWIERKEKRERQRQNISSEQKENETKQKEFAVRKLSYQPKKGGSKSNVNGQVSCRWLAVEENRFVRIVHNFIVVSFFILNGVCYQSRYNQHFLLKSSGASLVYHGSFVSDVTGAVL